MSFRGVLYHPFQHFAWIEGSINEAKLLSRDEIRLIKETMQQIQLPTPPWAQRLWGSPKICQQKYFEVETLNNFRRFFFWGFCQEVVILKKNTSMYIYIYLVYIYNSIYIYVLFLVGKFQEVNWCFSRALMRGNIVFFFFLAAILHQVWMWFRWSVELWGWFFQTTWAAE